MFSSAEAIFALGNIMAFLVGAYLFSLHAISLGTVYLVFYYTNLLSLPIEQIWEQLQEIQEASAGVKRVQQLLQTTSTLREEGKKSIPPGALDIHFQDVSFAYATAAPVLQHITFHLKAGEILGVLGRTGEPALATSADTPAKRARSYMSGSLTSPGRTLAEQIIVLKEGQIEATGTVETLWQRCEGFRFLWQTSLKEVEARE